MFFVWGLLFSFGLSGASVINASALEDNDAGLAPTPPMGWNCWNRFGGGITEKILMETADAMVSSGMKNAGYQYINIDDCWMLHERDANGDLVPDPVKFPHGLKYVADYVHSKGLKLGIYSSNGTLTCAGYPASQGNESRDAQKFAAWGVDLLKYDFCNNQQISLLTANAPDIDKITLSKGSFSESIEAEGSENTLSGLAKVVSSADCSGGKKVSGISDTNELLFNKVNVPSDGDYKLTISYCNGDSSRTIVVCVNNRAFQNYTLSGTGSFDTVGTYDMTVSLKAGVNTIKLYNPTNASFSSQTQYKTMRNALDATGRSIVLSLCEWGTNKPWLWPEGIGELRRTTSDIENTWDSVVRNFDNNEKLAAYNKSNGWNDPDIMEIGNKMNALGLTDTEGSTHFSMWCMSAAPLIAGNDLRSMSQTTADILTNKDMISIDQDSLGIQCTKLKSDGLHDVYTKPLANGDVAVMLLNRDKSEAAVSVTLEELGLDTDKTYAVLDCWAHSTHSISSAISSTLPKHGSAVYRIHQTFAANSAVTTGSGTASTKVSHTSTARSTASNAATGDSARIPTVGVLVFLSAIAAFLMRKRIGKASRT